ncbi:hypothetical protein [Actinokineospora xionganensis]|uniref:Uncharacterized protein n=1 Tax=Actinokineospora xionganensis TaxID=2684470 RepID=A0ABR7LAC9_9PSEU|nr:hypothetical protein [Actinokineospora xionganensis]MBC6449344.1 hypothetical protein [Actinokineospora xionganensis]
MSEALTGPMSTFARSRSDALDDMVLQRGRAAVVVAGQSVGVEDCRELLLMLGLDAGTERPHDPLLAYVGPAM